MHRLLGGPVQEKIDVKTVQKLFVFCYRYFVVLPSFTCVSINKFKLINEAKLGEVRILVLFLLIATKIIHFNTLI